MWTAIKAVVEFIAKLLWYTGLFVPALYALFGVALYLGWHFDPFAAGTYPKLYRIGFYITVGIALIIVYRRITEKSRQKRKERRKEEEAREREEERERKKQERADRRDREMRDRGYRTRYRRLRADRAKRKKEKEAKSDAEDAYYDALFGDRDGYNNKYTSSDYQSTYYGNLNNYKSYLDDGEDYYNDEDGKTAPRESECREEPKIYMSALEKDVLIHEYRDRFEVYKLSDGKKTLDRVEYK